MENEYWPKCSDVLWLGVKAVVIHNISREAQPKRNVYWPRPSVCMSVCLSLTAFLHYYTDLDVNWGNDRGFPLVVHYWVDLQLMHGFRCYDNIHLRKFIALYTANAYSAESEMSASACTCSMAGSTCG